MPTSTRDTIALALLGAGLAGLLVLLGWGQPAGADTNTYPPAQREVRACVLLPSAGAANAHPHLFRVLAAAEEMADEAGSPLRPGVRPPGWAFTNPLAPGTVTPGVRARWPDLPAGAPVAKEMAPYWEVFLDTTPLEDLLRFDLLLLPLPGGAPARFPPAAREKLRRLVERGAALWIDAEGASVDPSAPFFLRELGFAPGTADDPGGFRLSPADVRATVPPERRMLCTRHPLLTRPWRLTQAEVEALGTQGSRGFLARVTNLAGNGLPDPLLLPVLFSLGGFGDGLAYPVVVGGAYGDGLVVATNLGIGAAINDGFCRPPGAAGNAGRGPGSTRRRIPRPTSHVSRLTSQRRCLPGGCRTPLAEGE